MQRRAVVWWLDVLVPLWAVLIHGTYWEPVVRDGWGNNNWHRWYDLDLGGLRDIFLHGWTSSNPRLGQTVTTLLYTPGPYHVLITPVLELAMFYALTALALGRWPSLRRADDALAYATVFAIVALCTPQFGPMLFYRPFTGNYLFGLLLNALWLVPYRMHASAPLGGAWWWSPVLLVLGFAAGLCNEHTGVAFLALGAAATASSPRAIRPWMIAGLVGLLAGYVLLLLAPGHAARYGGLAQQAGVVERILDRGAAGNLAVVGKLVMYLAWSLPWVGLAVIARTDVDARERRVLLGLAAGGLVITLTLLASPKIGPRLYLASIALIAAALAGWVVPRLRRTGAVLAAVVIGYVLVRCVTTMATVGPIGKERMRRLDTYAGRWSVIGLPRYPELPTKWFIGEDMESEALRAGTATDYGLSQIVLEP